MPNQPTLRLAPHEIAPNRDNQWDSALLRFRANWQGCERDFVAQAITQPHESMIFFALADETARGNFVRAQTRVANNELDLDALVFEPRTQFSDGEITQILQCATDVSWGRVYYLNDDLDVVEGSEEKCWRLFLAQSGWGQWSLVPTEYTANALFRWNGKPDEARKLALLPPLELLAQIRGSLADIQSDAAAARAFASLSSDERHQRCHALSRGDTSQWRQVLQWYFTAHFASTTASRLVLKIVVYSPREEADAWGYNLMQNLLPFQTHFVNWTRQYFAPAIDLEYTKSSHCATDWLKRPFKLFMRVERPTQHERLEALLKLRDWLRDKAAPAEIEALLRAE